MNVRQSLRHPRLFHHRRPDPPPFSDQNTISSPQAAADRREEPLKLQQIARILDNVTAPILTLFQISHFQEQSQFWGLVAAVLSAKEGANMSECGNFMVRGENADGEYEGRQRMQREVMDMTCRHTINPSSWHLRSIVSPRILIKEHNPTNMSF